MTWVFLLLFVGVIAILYLRVSPSSPPSSSSSSPSTSASPPGVDRIAVEESIRAIPSNQLPIIRDDSAEDVVPAYLATPPTGSLDAGYC